MRVARFVVTLALALFAFAPPATALVSPTLTVSKAGGGTGMVTSSPKGISCGTTCAFAFAEGTTVTLTGVPGANSEAPKWSGCDSVKEGNCLVKMSSPRSVTATFNFVKRVLSVTKKGTGTGTVTSSPPGIDCGLACLASFDIGTTVTLTGVPFREAEVPEWSGCDSVDEEDRCVVTLASTREVTAVFNLPKVTLSVLLKGTGTGTVKSSPGGIECGEDCSQVYFSHTSVTLTATPAPGSVFLRWSGGSCAGTAPCQKTINSTRTVNAVFAATGTRTLSVSRSGSGEGKVTSKRGGIDCGQTCTSEVEVATTVTLRATPAPGSTFAGWSGACAGIEKTCKVTMSEAREATAAFEKPAPPPPIQCVVPRLRGKTLARARAALTAAHCALGRVRKPKGAKASKLRVKGSVPGAGSVLAAGARVSLKLIVKR